LARDFLRRRRFERLSVVAPSSYFVCIEETSDGVDSDLAHHAGNLVELAGTGNEVNRSAVVDQPASTCGHEFGRQVQ
jgi:hypothetical protein